MFELKFKTKSIKTYGKRRHRIVSYLDKSPTSSTIPNTPGLCVVKNVIPEKINPTPKVKRQVNLLKTPILPNKPVYNQVFTSDLKNCELKATTYQGLLHLSQITYTKDKLVSTQPQVTAVIHRDGPDSESSNATQSSALNTCSLTNSTINSKLTGDSKCTFFTESSAARIQSIDEIKPLRSDDHPSIVNNQEKNTNDDITWFRSHQALHPTHTPIEVLSSESEVETSPIPRRVRAPLGPKPKINPSLVSTETNSPTRTRSGRQLRQFKANNPDTTLERKSFRTVRDPKYVVSSGNHKRILVNSPKPYRSSPFRKRPTLKPSSTYDFEVLVTPMKFKSQVHSDFFQSSKVLSPSSTPLSKNVPSTFSPRFMCGSPLARSVSRCSISKDGLESQESIIGARNSNTKALEDLLHLFGQQDVATFQSFLGSGLASVRKIGEATFSEVFSCTYPPLSTTVALKVLPFGKGSEVLVNGEVQKTPHDIYQEAFITLVLSNLGTLGQDSCTDSLSHFIKVHRVGICQGEYPQEMLDQWDEWAANNPSENERPDFFAHDQLYCVLILEHGGNDLEHVKLQSWDQAKSVLTQVAYSIGFAEKHLNFEHRDLHWGNIMVADTNQEHFQFSEPNGSTSMVSSFGIRVSIIDYTLSRLERDSEIFYVSIDDEEIFAGEGDYQFQIYRMIHSETGCDWAGYHPRTNVFWLHYLCDKLLNNKRLHKRAVARRPLAALYDRILTYSSVQDLLSDCFFKSCSNVDVINSELNLLSLE